MGARSFRIGGATDWHEYMPDEAGFELIKKRGRWASDIAYIYRRSLIQPQLAGSAQVGSMRGDELERVFAGWVQPAK